MIVLVCGGRHFSDRDWLFSVLNEECKKKRIVGLIQGKASGADTLAAEWQSFRIKREWQTAIKERPRTTIPDLWGVGCPARWDDLEAKPLVLRYKNGVPYNAAAGGIRNQFMLTWHPNKVIAFPGGSGTNDMKERARRAGIEVMEVR